MTEVAKQDGRYKVDAFVFVQHAWAYAQFELGMGRPRPFGLEGADLEDAKSFEDLVEAAELELEEPPEPRREDHLTGQQFCEAIRLYALDTYGMLARMVLNSWGVHTTGDFGEIVFKMIEIGEMTKSDTDRREDFDNLYDFGEAFERDYEITILDPDEV
jgi:uncharacterized repeat protein (TIGR04138 family)